MTDSALTHAPGMSLRVRDLSHRAGARRLLDAISLSLKPAGVTVIMGPNGAGKSLFLRLVHGLATPTAGQISWGGALLSPALTRRQSLVFQNPVLLRRSVAANVDFILRARGRSDPAKRDAALARVGLSDEAHHPARRLSGGQQQRLALARALVTEPEALLLDEPTASLDPASVLMIERIVADTAAQGTKIVFVTHDIGQARRLADDVVFLHAGQLAEYSPAARFFDAPRSEAAQAYLQGRLLI
ncbi:phosphate ABC transporter ATP-binding protein [Roseovarius aestuariivivens]|uniref:ABC transporter ATP-binding protein n=1 Tax=Roseovarius aestuariivivens TaxID=1888910 RepID=UPI001FD8F23F|nr:phosphate ABC transporter ATP-binding protein [Roseovarius aestuariivivens]